MIKLKVMDIKTVLALILVLVLCNQCEKGTDGFNSLISFDQSAPVEICPYGGITVYTGLDRNGNNVLDIDEVTETTYVCNGGSGNSALIRTEIASKGENCPSGGYEIFTGIDLNGDGELNSNEVQDTVYICSGSNALIRTEVEPKGQNCEAGGHKIFSGIDLNGDGLLNDIEIQDTFFICHGVSAKQLIIGDLSDPDLNYTKLDPALQMWANRYILYTYELDVDSNGSSDVRFTTWTEYSPTYVWAYSKVKSLSSNTFFSIVDTANFPKIHKTGDIINNLNNWRSGEFLLSSFDGKYFYSDTIPNVEKYEGIWNGVSNYLAFRIDKKSTISYGWMHINVKYTTSQVTLYSYAYK